MLVQPVVGPSAGSIGMDEQKNSSDRSGQGPQTAHIMYPSPPVPILKSTYTSLGPQSHAKAPLRTRATPPSPPASPASSRPQTPTPRLTPTPGHAVERQLPEGRVHRPMRRRPPDPVLGPARLHIRHYLVEKISRWAPVHDHTDDAGDAPFADTP